jgi:hypothetical protein
MTQGEFAEVGGGSGSGGGGPVAFTQYQFVLRPGGVAGGTVFTTWAALMGAAALVPGPHLIQLDGTIVPGGCHATAGTWNLDNFEFITTTNGATTDALTIDDGAHFTFNSLYLSDGATFQCNGTTPVYAATPNTVMILDLDASITSNAGKSVFIAAGAGSSPAIYLRDGASLGDGVTPTISVAAGVQLTVFGFNISNVNAHTVTGLGAFVALADNTSTISATQDGGVTVVLPGTNREQYSFVFQPGGVPGGNVYVDETTLQNAMALCAGPKLLQVDSSIAPAIFVNPNWHANGVTITGSDFNSTLQFQGAGSILPTTNDLTLENVTVEAHGPASVWIPSSGLGILKLDNSLLQSVAGAAPFLEQTAAGGLTQVILDNLAILGDGVHAAITIDAGATLPFTLANSSQTPANALAGAGTAVVGLNSDSSIAAPQAVAVLTIILNSVAQNVAYTPASLPHWSGVAPSSVANALDRIAAKITPIP